MSYFGPLKEYEIMTITNLVVYFFCTLIFGIILNTIVTKIVIANCTESISSPSLIDQQTGSVVGNLTANDVQSTVNSLQDIEVEETEDFPQLPVYHNFVEQGSVSDGIIATLFRQSFE